MPEFLVDDFGEMPKRDYILPMIKTRRIIFVVYDGFELLDLSGPASVFSAASWDSPRYRQVVASPKGGLVNSYSNISVDTQPLAELRILSHDTVLATGALPSFQQPVLGNKPIIHSLLQASKYAERYGSICTGAFFLATAGLLNDKRAATHWAGHDDLSENFEKVSVEDDALYIADERLWTSAGVTAGIDMALAMVEQDHGAQLMAAVAKALVVDTRRPGDQTQFSDLLAAQTAADGVFSSLVDWIESSLGQPIRVSELASMVNMSERTFFRKFAAAIGMSPSKYVESRRLEQAKKLLNAGESVKKTAADLGFKSASAFRTAFKNRYGVLPSMYAKFHE